jgi:hypothetical protein
MSTFAASVTARWLDPTNGSYTNIGTFSNAGTHNFSPLGKNAGGDPDWVLVLTARRNQWSCRSEEKHGLTSDIGRAVVDSLKALDPMGRPHARTPQRAATQTAIPEPRVFCCAGQR